MTSLSKTRNHGKLSRKLPFACKAVEQLEERAMLAIMVGVPHEAHLPALPSNQQFAPHQEVSSAPSNLVGHWTFDNAIVHHTLDASNNGHHGLVSGAHGSTFGKAGSSLRFDGVDDFVNTGNWDVQGDQLTIASWIHADSFTGSFRDGRIVSKAVGDQEQDHSWMLSTIAVGTETRLRFRLNTNGITRTLIADQGDVSTQTWHHVAAVYDGASMRLFLDGQQVGQMAASGTITPAPNAPVWLGNNPVSRAQPFHGLLDETQVYQSALTAAEIQSLSTSATGAAVVTGGAVLASPGGQSTGQVSPDAYFAYESEAYYPFDQITNAISIDRSANQHHSVAHGATVAVGQTGNAVAFDGVDDYMNLGNWDVTGNALTIATWVNADAFVGQYRDGRIISKAVGAGAQDHYWMLSTIAQGSETLLRFRLKTDGNTDTLIADSGNLSPGAWYHVAAVYDGATMRLYLNGAEVGSMPKTGPISANQDAAVWAGNNPGSQAQPFDGRIDDMQVFESALSAFQIMTLITQAFATAPAQNQPPVVNAGVDRSGVVSTPLSLNGSATDDGLPSNGTLTTTWTKLSGPGDVTFADASLTSTSATFTQTGTYVLELRGNDGTLSTVDTLSVSVNDPQVVQGYFVSPTGSPTGNGSIDNPWDLQSALKNSTIAPGTTIWMRGGTYLTSRPGGLVSTISGTASQPITVRAFPGEHVVWDSFRPGATDYTDSYIFINGNYTQFWGFEITNSDPGTRQSAFPAGSSYDVKRGMVRSNGDYNKFINLVVHDLNQGFGFWEDGAGGEIYGTIIYNTGYMPSQGVVQGHSIYTGNEIGTKRIADNMIFNAFGGGIQAYEQAGKHLKGYVFEGNAIFNNSTAPTSQLSEILVGGSGTPAENIIFRDNNVYSSINNARSEFGYNWGSGNNDNLTLTNNRFTGTVQFNDEWLTTPTASGNIIYGGSVIENNDGNAPTSGISIAARAGTEVIVRPNEYEPGRGHIVVYNWDERGTINANLSTVLSVGATYDVFHVYDLKTPVVSGTYNGGDVIIPMQATVAPTPLGTNGPSPNIQSNQFGAFIVMTR